MWVVMDAVKLDTITYDHAWLFSMGLSLQAPAPKATFSKDATAIK